MLERFSQSFQKNPCTRAANKAGKPKPKTKHKKLCTRGANKSGKPNRAPAPAKAGLTSVNNSQPVKAPSSSLRRSFPFAQARALIVAWKNPLSA